jgi:hypothetical protein
LMFIVLSGVQAYTTSSIDMEPENGILNGAQIVNDSSASYGKYVEFPGKLNSKTRFLWVWEYRSVDTSGKRIDFINFLIRNNITRIHLESEYLVSKNQTLLSQIISDFKLSGIEVELLFGYHPWTLAPNHKTPISLAKQSVAFYNSYPNSRPVGMHFDIEPSGLPEWSVNKTEVANQLLDLYEALRSEKGQMTLSADLQMVFNVTSISRNGQVKPLIEWALDYLDEAVIMSYRDNATVPTTDNIIFHSRPAIEYATKLNKIAYVSVETTCGIEPEKVTFCEEGVEFMEQQLDLVDTQYKNNSGYGGIVIHDYKGYKALLGQ